MNQNGNIRTLVPQVTNQIRNSHSSNRIIYTSKSTLRNIRLTMSKKILLQLSKLIDKLIL